MVRTAGSAAAWGVLTTSTWEKPLSFAATTRSTPGSTSRYSASFPSTSGAGSGPGQVRLMMWPAAVIVTRLLLVSDAAVAGPAGPFSPAAGALRTVYAAGCAAVVSAELPAVFPAEVPAAPPEKLTGEVVTTGFQR